MSANRKTPLCRYRYDPLDRLADCTPSAQTRTQRFYLKERLTSEIQGSVQRLVFQQGDQLLAQQQRQDDVVETTLLAIDLQHSVLYALDATRPHPFAYAPYGHRSPENGLLSLLGFNGERPDPVTGHYLLGNGYRAFNPVLMRFNSPDSMSPFGKGGLNAYAYGQGDPINTSDPTGHFNFITSPLKGVLNRAKLRTPKEIVYVHGVKLRISPGQELETFIRNPTTPFSPLKRPLSPEIIDSGIPQLELSLINDSNNLIKQELQAAHIIKLRPVSHNKIRKLSNFLENIKLSRTAHRANLEYFKRRTQELTPSSDDPPPSYKKTIFWSSGHTPGEILRG
ncbi:RHS repeat-associated core domain-containing protein [Pseudomonas viciae]|uniref:RHS repeat-associated core domain-containing protein n=1 Tax=Pseudomonas viciae TaxID=2505979 RepID=A0A4P7PMU9_9PSED|nr:RHS repeat-associated core domain-containing protein [Pseudomonas viciae]QBZ92267.1 RHS repeat-associated core domain-containing protein [Pseudomonas viciae]UZE86066.1 RHS repeat-associated core domain-containing protein [Pseudomonas viciae]